MTTLPLVYPTEVADVFTVTPDRNDEIFKDRVAEPDGFVLAGVVKSLTIFETSPTGSVILDRDSMSLDYPYSFWLEDVFLVAVKRADGTIEFFSICQQPEATPMSTVVPTLQQSPKPIAGVQTYAFALSPNARAELTLRGDITPDDLELLRDNIELTIKALARTPSNGFLRRE